VNACQQMNPLDLTGVIVSIVFFVWLGFLCWLAAKS
jgi:hypothetical protein